ncbi:HigA family addiction module antidote protein [Belnapia sp. T18]|uniref:HigA family addiction module antidote protein n=1 Tax=Belnapia arida TaxID=2804533 RepID=A0ABS1UCC4_9PROT|nr:HigA family addiction module antitoxin [Belnapia arida]MBL6081352.1 HigA family addiction module antidote protein [Belnapia arida]
MSIRREELADLDLSDVTDGERLAPVLPGDVLGLEFMKPMGLSARALARDMCVPPNRITGILNGERAITAETALLLARCFGTTPEFWMNLQVAHDLELAREAVGTAA